MSTEVPSGSSSGQGGSDPAGPGLQEGQEAVRFDDGRGQPPTFRRETGEPLEDPGGGVSAGSAQPLLLATASVLDAAPLGARSAGGADDEPGVRSGDRPVQLAPSPTVADQGSVDFDGELAGHIWGNGTHRLSARRIGRGLGSAVATLKAAVPIGKAREKAGAERKATGPPGEAGGFTEGAEVVRRKKAMAIGLSAVILSSGISWAAASRIRSPAEIAARTAPPAASLITVPVEQRVLSSDVVVRGTVRYGTPIVVTLPLSALKRTSIVTTPPTKDAVLNEGSVAMTVSGRPVLVLQGAQPAYRDLGPGATGGDVMQLEEALARLGFDPGGRDGVYDDATGAAVSAWYRSAGWTALGPTEEQLAMARAGQADRFAAQAEALGAQEALAAAEADLRIAQERAQALRAPGTVPPGVPSAAAMDAAARARAEQQRVQAAATLASRTRALEQALQAQRQAQARLDEARTRQPPPSTAEFAGLARAVQDAGKVVEIARDEMTTAQEAASAASSAEVPGVTLPDPAAAVDAATAAAEVARATKAVEFARRRAALMGSRPSGTVGVGRLGIQVPADEVLFFPTLPRRVDEVKVQAGSEVVGPVMTVTNSSVVVESFVAAGDVKLIRAGAPMTIRSQELGIEAQGSVTHVAETPGTNGADPQRFYVQATPTDAPMSLVGAGVTLTVTVESTQGEVLAVPVTALSVAGDGSTRIQVTKGDGSTRYVTVTPGLAAKGLVAVTPVKGALEKGDEVVVGTKAAGAGGGKPGASTS